MKHEFNVLDMSCWLNKVRSGIEYISPDLLPLFDIYAAEAIFGRRYIDSDIERLVSGGKILEIGAGSTLLSCQLKREGFDVHALEPIGEGFSHLNTIRGIVLDIANDQGCLPTMLYQPAESLDRFNLFDYAFSVNVMEHVGDVERTLKNIVNSLVQSASYRFICPNYIFPYEPHFNIPILISKRLTERCFARQIFACQTIPDPEGTWKSLNWINVIQIRRYIKKFPWLTLAFKHASLVSMLERVSFDSKFAKRRSPIVCSFLRFLVKLRIHHLFRFVPATIQPIMDCEIKKTLYLVVS